MEEKQFETGHAQDVANGVARVGKAKVHAQVLSVTSGAKHQADPGAIDEADFRKVDGRMPFTRCTEQVDLIARGGPYVFDVGCGDFAGPEERRDWIRPGDEITESGEAETNSRASKIVGAM